MKKPENKPENTKPAYRKPAYILALLFLLLSVASLIWIDLNGRQPSGCTAEIYQDGKLIHTIDLSAVPKAYTFTVTGANGGTNVIEVRPGSIGVLSADCPDKLCVRQGFISNSLLPITCLPNRLVIQIRDSDRTAVESPDSETITPDIITY